MCIAAESLINPVLGAVINSASTGFTAQAQSTAGANQKALADTQAAQLVYTGSVAQSDALVQAQLIRKQAGRDIGTANTVAAASGVVVDEGSSSEVDRHIYQGSEHDAYTAILNGDRQAQNLNAQAAYTRQGGANAEAAGNQQAAGTVLQGAANYFKTTGWKTSTVTPAVDPVSDLIYSTPATGK
jgi:hypothetical protein